MCISCLCVCSHLIVDQTYCYSGRLPIKSILFQDVLGSSMEISFDEGIINGNFVLTDGGWSEGGDSRQLLDNLRLHGDDFAIGPHVMSK